jgi:hypothetical protein
MISSRVSRYGILFVISCFLSAPVFAQRGQGRVFTNEDIGSQPSAPPAPAPATPAASPAAAAVAAAAPSDSAPANPASAAQENLRQLTAIVNDVGAAADLLGDKIREGGADAATLARWTTMKDCLTNVLVEFRGFAAQAQAEAAPASPAPSQQQSAPPAQTNAQ